MKMVITNKDFIRRNIEGYILEKYGRDDLIGFRKNSFTPNKHDEKLIGLLKQLKG